MLHPTYGKGKHVGRTPSPGWWEWYPIEQVRQQLTSNYKRMPQIAPDSPSYHPHLDQPGHLLETFVAGDQRGLQVQRCGSDDGIG